MGQLSIGNVLTNGILAPALSFFRIMEKPISHTTSSNAGAHSMSLQGFSYLDLCRKVGGAQLLVENSDFFAELLRGSAVIASTSIEDSGVYRISDIEFASWLNTDDSITNGPEMGGDPPECPFAAEIPFYGGGYLVLTSDYAEDAYQLEQLITAAFRVESVVFQRKVKEVAALLLVISNECLRNAGVTRKSEPAEPVDKIHWPRGGNARVLEKSVSFEKSVLVRALARFDVGLDGLERVSFQQEGISCNYRHLQNNPMRTRPLLRFDESLVLVAPSMVLSAIRNSIFAIAEEEHVLDRFTSEFQVAVRLNLMKNAQRMNWLQRAECTFKEGDILIDEIVYEVDADKIMVVYLITDRLVHGTTDSENMYWDLETNIAAFKERVGFHHNQLHGLFADRAEIVHCLVSQGVGRFSIIGLPSIDLDNGMVIALSADEFQHFALLNRGDSLALWRVSAAKSSISSKMSIIGGFLDHYALFRNRNESYYFGDEGIPDHVFFSAAGIGPRLDMVRQIDRHFVQNADRDAVVEVFRLENREGFNVYLREPGPGNRLDHLVEGYPSPIWILADENSDLKDESTMSSCFHLVSTCAFWIWKMTDEFLAVRPKAHSNSHIRIEVEVTDFALSENGKTEPTSCGFEMEQVVPNLIRIRFNDDFALLSGLPTNCAELELASALLRAVAVAFKSELDESSISAIVSKFNDPNLRRIAVVHETLAEILDSSQLPRALRVLPFDEQIIQGQLSKELELSGAFHAGVLPDEKRQEILNKTTGLIYGELQKWVAKYERHELITKLIAGHEGLLSERRQYEHITNSHLAAFGRTEENVRELQHDISQVDKASIASRFLIEFVAAQPPNGDHQVSKSGCQRLYALAASIFRTGQVSDSVKYGISDHSIKLLKSKRVVVDDEEYDSVLAKFQNEMFDRIVQSGMPEREQKSRKRNDREQSGATREADEFEIATKAEFGYSASEITRFLACIAGSPYTSKGGLGKASKVELFDFIERELAMDRKNIGLLLRLLSLTKRIDFLKPPHPHKVTDVYPWVFNRSLSYLRRPFVVCDDVVYWGNRAINQAGNYFLDICLSGRLKNPTSDEMKHFSGRVVNRLGNAFNDDVIAMLKSRDDFVVRGRIKKFNGNRMTRQNGEDIGDVDVLAVCLETRTIFPLETKCFTFAKTSAEIARERDNLFGELSAESGKIANHVERLTWLRKNLVHVLAELGLSKDDCWNLVPAIVLDVDLISPKLEASPILITTKDRLIETLKTTGC